MLKRILKALRRLIIGEVEMYVPDEYAQKITALMPEMGLNAEIRAVEN